MVFTHFKNNKKKTTKKQKKKKKQTNSTLNFLKRNLRNFPPNWRKTAYISLVRSILDNGSIVWDSIWNRTLISWKQYRQATRFITDDYKSREEGCITGLLQSLELSSLKKNRGSSNRLIVMYNLVEGLGPAKQKRSVKVKQFNDCETRNILDRHTTEKKKKQKKKQKKKKQKKTEDT